MPQIPAPPAKRGVRPINEIPVPPPAVIPPAPPRRTHPKREIVPPTPTPVPKPAPVPIPAPHKLPTEGDSPAK